MKLSVFDRDVIGSNDLIGETAIPLTRFFKRSLRLYKKHKKTEAWPTAESMLKFPQAPKKRPNTAAAEAAAAVAAVADKVPGAKAAGAMLSKIQMPGRTDKDPDKMWLKIWAPDPATNEPQCQGEVLVEYCIMHADVTEMMPAGTGRNDPNMNPFIPEPDRFRFDFRNPFKSLYGLLGPEMCLKLGAALLCLGLIMLCIITVPLVISAKINSATGG